MTRFGHGLLLLIFATSGIVLAGCVTLTPYSDIRDRLPPPRLISIDGDRVHVRDRGTGEPVVFLHGFGASGFSWRKVVERLPAYRTIVPDLRGFGYTERPPGIEPYTRGAQVELVRELIERLGLDRVDLVGHSYGGAIALAFAQTHPDRLRSLTLVDSARPDYPMTRRRWIARFRPITALYVRSWALRRPWIRRALERSVWDDSLVTSELVGAYRDRLRIEGAVRAYRGITARGPGKETEVRLGELEMPVLVIWGAEDELISIVRGREATAEIPCHRFVSVPETGHLPQEERPGLVAKVLREFLAAPTRSCGRDDSLDPS